MHGSVGGKSGKFPTQPLGDHAILGGIEFMHMIVKGQMKDGGIALTPAQQFYSLAA